MRRIILFVILFIAYGWSKPQFDKLAAIFGGEISLTEEGIAGYVDAEGKLWVLGAKRDTMEVEKPHMNRGVIIRENGTVDTFYYPARQYPDRAFLRYLYFWLYDQNGKEINEGVLGDSVEIKTLFPVENGGALIIWRCRTDINVRIADPTDGYVRATFIDRNGVVAHAKTVTSKDAMYYVIGELQQGILVGLGHHGICRESKLISVDSDTIAVKDTLNNIPRFNLLQQLDATSFLTWSRVDTATEYGYDERYDRTYPKDYILLKKYIEINIYNAESNKCTGRRYYIPDASFRKYVGFEMYPLQSYPQIGYEPEVQSLKLGNGNVLATILMKENDKPVAYQMLFDSAGQYIAPGEITVSKPRDINTTPDASNIYIKRRPAERDKAEKYKGAYVYIWGYDEEGILYWKNYRID